MDWLLILAGLSVVGGLLYLVEAFARLLLVVFRAIQDRRGTPRAWRTVDAPR